MTPHVLAFALGVVLVALAACAFWWRGELAEWNRSLQVRWLDRYSGAMSPSARATRRPLDGLLTVLVRWPLTGGAVLRSPRYHRYSIAALWVALGLSGAFLIVAAFVGR